MEDHIMSDDPISGGPVTAEFTANLAAASRVLAARGVVDAFGHISHRHPDARERYFMSRAMAPALVTPDDIIEYSLDNEPVSAKFPCIFPVNTEIGCRDGFATDWVHHHFLPKAKNSPEGFLLISSHGQRARPAIRPGCLRDISWCSPCLALP